MLPLKALELTFRTRLPFCSREARKAVLSSIQGQPPLTTRQLYERVDKIVKRPASYTRVRQAVTLLRPSKRRGGASSGPVPSYNYLKEVVLPHLLKSNKVEKVHTHRTVSKKEMDKRMSSMSKAERQALGDKPVPQVPVWLWRPVSPSQLRLAVRKRIAERKERQVDVFGTEVGAGEDWSHLSKRRQRARARKVAKDVRWLRAIQRAKAERAKNVTPKPSRVTVQTKLSLGLEEGKATRIVEPAAV